MEMQRMRICSTFIDLVEEEQMHDQAAVRNASAPPELASSPSSRVISCAEAPLLRMPLANITNQSPPASSGEAPRIDTRGTVALASSSGAPTTSRLHSRSVSRRRSLHVPADFLGVVSSDDDEELLPPKGWEPEPEPGEGVTLRI